MTARRTVAQALVEFLSVQYSERDGVEHRSVEGCFGIFGHGNLSGLGQALLESERRSPGTFRYYQARNEQAMVHIAAGFSRMRNRLSTLACTSSIGPGATNMVTGAALATVNRLPVLLLPGDTFATRVAEPVLQQLEYSGQRDVTVNDAFRPVSRFFDRVNRPEQLFETLFGAMQVLTDPAATGAATICLPEDVQTEAFDWPDELFERRVWHVPRNAPDRAAIGRAAEIIRRAERPLLVAGGGVIYSEATDALRRFAESTGIPVAETQAGKGSLRYDHPRAVGAVGATGSAAANEIARDADVVIGVGTRWTDFTTASRSAFQHPRVRFVSLNVATPDALKLAGEAVVGDARVALEMLTDALGGWAAADDYASRTMALAEHWNRVVDEAFRTSGDGLPSQVAVIGAVNECSAPTDVVVCAAGSMPGDLHKLWRTRDPKGYHVEYGYSCMGYEIAGGLGVKMASPEREVFVLVGDGSYLMMSQELVTAVQESIKVTVVLVDNHGYASIGNLSESVGVDRFGTAYRYRNHDTGTLSGDYLPVDFVANAESLGARVFRPKTIDELRACLADARGEVGHPVLIYVETDPFARAPDSMSWWDVAVAEISELDGTAQARESYERDKKQQRFYL
jgi:3D-(3,5/4)-trihydroxycyclohexane-1,2-dione acylhydrolase (decyclizing)